MTDLYLITKGFSWLERLIVVQEVAGSSPVFHPKVSPRVIGGFFVYYINEEFKNEVWKIL